MLRGVTSSHDDAAGYLLEKNSDKVVILLLLLLVVALMLLVLGVARFVVAINPRRVCADLGSRQIDVYAAFVVLGGIVQAELAAEFFDAWFDLLDAAGAVISLADDDVEMALPASLGVTDPGLQDPFSLLDKLPVQVYCIIRDPLRGIILAENIVGSLPVVFFHCGPVLFALVRQTLRLGAIPVVVGFPGLSGVAATGVKDHQWDHQVNVFASNRMLHFI